MSDHHHKPHPDPEREAREKEERERPPSAWEKLVLEDILRAHPDITPAEALRLMRLHS